MLNARGVKVTVGIPTYNRGSLLRESMASVLSQSYSDLRLLVCDNASEDGTEEIVASFGDPRIDYVRSDRNIGMVGNFNRVIELAETEFLVVLPDDDLLYPDHIGLALRVFERNPNVGVVHTAFDVIDGSSQVVHPARTLVRAERPVETESGGAYLERSMRLPWTVCWPSAVFRTRAIVDAGGLRMEDEPMGDVPLLMRIACDWDFACLSSPLAALRVHAGTATAALGLYNGVNYDLLDIQPQLLYDRRKRFLDEGRLPAKRAERYRSVAEGTFRRDKVGALAVRAGSTASWMSTWRALAQLMTGDARILLLPPTWRLCAAQLGGRHAKRAAYWFLKRPAQAGV